MHIATQLLQDTFVEFRFPLLCRSLAFVWASEMLAGFASIFAELHRQLQRSGLQRKLHAAMRNGIYSPWRPQSPQAWKHWKRWWIVDIVDLPLRQQRSGPDRQHPAKLHIADLHLQLDSPRSADHVWRCPFAASSSRRRDEKRMWVLPIDQAKAIDCHRNWPPINMENHQENAHTSMNKPTDRRADWQADEVPAEISSY